MKIIAEFNGPSKWTPLRVVFVRLFPKIGYAPPEMAVRA